MNSEFKSVDIHPKLGLPQLALWQHVGVTIGITLDKNGSLIVIRQELNPVTCKLDGKQLNSRCILCIMEVLLNDFNVQDRHQRYIGDNSFGEIVKIHRRHGFGENTDRGNREEIRSSCLGF